MTDPFFRVNDNVKKDDNIPPKEFDKNSRIDELKLQQKKLEEEFLNLNNYLKQKELSTQQKLSIQKKMQELDFEYKKNASELKSLWFGSSVKANTKTKTWSKISIMQFFVWCVILLFLLIWWLAAIFYYLITNPTQMSSVWVTPQTAKTLLQTFVVIFFGFLVLVGFLLLIVNAYRLIVVKNKSKIWYVIWVIIWFAIFIFSIVFWATLLSRIAGISPGDLSDPYKLIRPILEQKDRNIYITSDTNLKLIAPGLVSFEMNTSLFDSQILPNLWQSQLQSVSLDCWNAQKLNLDFKSRKFSSRCIYYSKWIYPLSLVISYINLQTSEKLEKSFDVWSLNFESEIVITNTDNSVKNVPLDVIVWKAPAKVTFDASQVFRDFNLTSYNIVWDVDWDWTVDKRDSVMLTHVYKQSRVYYVLVRFPWLNNYLYTFPIRIEQSDVPVCEVSMQLIKWTQYNIRANFLEPNVTISDYQFDIFDSDRSKVIDSIKNKRWYIDYTLPSKWNYSVIVKFITQEWKLWQCESDDIEIESLDFEILYDLYYKSPLSPNFVKIDQKNSDIFDGSELIIKEIPTVLRLDISRVVPDGPWVTKKVFVDGKPILSDDKSFQITIDESKNYELNIVVEDVNRDAKTEKKISVKIKRDDVVWNLLITPDVVWTDPFTVQFDASTTTVNDPDDEIVYFSWDFGDGEIKQNFSQSIISHTYNYDSKNENWEYFPKVTIKTKKWREIVIWSGTRIIVKKSLVNLSIKIDSHPAQVAKVWDKVDFSLQMDWLPKTVTWSFGDWSQLECKARECMVASRIYSSPWIFNVKVFVTFDDKPDLENSINLKIQ